MDFTSHFFRRTDFNLNESTRILIEKSGYYWFPRKGIPVILPIGKRLTDNIRRMCQDIFESNSFIELGFPAILHKDWVQKAKVLEQYGDSVVTLAEPMDGYMLAATSEELFIMCASQLVKSYKGLPLRLFKNADSFRYELRPQGILCSMQFSGIDGVWFSRSKQDARIDLKRIFEDTKVFFDKLQLPIALIEGSNKEFEVLYQCPEGEKTLEKSAICRLFGSQQIVNKEFDYSEKYSSLGMGYISKKVDFSNFFVTGADGKQFRPTMGTFGLGVQKIVHALFDHYQDNHGFAFPRGVRPFDICVIPFKSQQLEIAISLAKKLNTCSKEINVVVDDQFSLNMKKRMSLSDFHGIPLKLVLGPKEVAEESISIRPREGHEDKIGVEKLEQIFTRL